MSQQTLCSSQSRFSNTKSKGVFQTHDNRRKLTVVDDMVSISVFVVEIGVVSIIVDFIGLVFVITVVI